MIFAPIDPTPPDDEDERPRCTDCKDPVSDEDFDAFEDGDGVTCGPCWHFALAAARASAKGSS